ncbi:MAG: hypothetical protein JRN08_10045, partial [Nitrososphaerota archaeon]|nr:hypothetical protein [Nitrososphaerota archaeon]
MIAARRNRRGKRTLLRALSVVFFVPLGLKEAARMIHEAKRPLLYIGGGTVHSGAEEMVLEL